MADDRCPFCGEPAIRHCVNGVVFRCGTSGPDINGEYSTGHTCDITSFTRRISELEQQLTAAQSENAELRRRVEEAEHGSRSPDDRGPCALCGAAWSAHLGEAGVCPSGTVPASSVYVPTLRILKEAAERWEVKP